MNVTLETLCAVQIHRIKGLPHYQQKMPVTTARRPNGLCQHCGYLLGFSMNRSKLYCTAACRSQARNLRERKTSRPYQRAASPRKH